MENKSRELIMKKVYVFRTKKQNQIKIIILFMKFVKISFSDMEIIRKNSVIKTNIYRTRIDFFIIFWNSHGKVSAKKFPQIEIKNKNREYKGIYLTCDI